tara:strand:+ start:493 stop:903 length:411 start_codon:yes stop_codon:yes gene_type:complete
MGKLEVVADVDFGRYRDFIRSHWGFVVSDFQLNGVLRDSEFVDDVERSMRSSGRDAMLQMSVKGYSHRDDYWNDPSGIKSAERLLLEKKDTLTTARSPLPHCERARAKLERSGAGLKIDKARGVEHYLPKKPIDYR